MIIDAPLALPNSGQYHLLGKTEITQKLAEHLSRIRPGAEFSGFVSDPSQVDGALLIVSDPTCSHAAELIRDTDRDDENVVIFPLPMEDMWSWWDLAERNLENIEFDGDARMDQNEFVAMLIEMGRSFENPEGDAVPLNPGSYLSMNQNLVSSHNADIVEVLEGLSDDASRQNYSRLMIQPPQMQWSHYLSRVFRTMQYFEHLDFSSCEVVVNGGVFEGFEFPFFASKLPRGATIHNIDPLGLDFLSEYSRSWMDIGLQNFVEHRVALFEEETELEFQAEKSGQVSLGYEKAEDGSNISLFPAKRLDTLVAELALDRIDLLKLDLEGGDGPALIGGLQTIKTFRPQLALSIYHYSKDFWEIPQLMMRTLPDYDFHLNTYSFERWETILYGIPKERSRLK